jgi:hypothetical protein
VIRKEPGTHREFCDYNWLCGADPSVIHTLDPVTGRTGFMRNNDLDGVYFVKNKEYAGSTCRTRNADGGCEDYEE